MRANRIILIAFLVSLAAGCHKRRPIVVLPPVPAPGPGPTVVPAPIPAPPEPPLAPPAFSPSPLEAADRAFAQGNYEEAGRAYEAFLKDNPAPAQRDFALFRLGLSFAFRPSSAANWQRAVAAFKQLIDECPTSPFRAEADLFVSLRSELDQSHMDNRQLNQKVKQLTTELERLKKIDADRGRRP
jgi:hypothetical protein